MEILRNLLGSLASGIVRLLVSVGVLAAAYFFIVKPALHTTENGINSANRTFEKSFGTEVNLNDIGKTIEDVNRRVQREIRRSFHTAARHGSPARLVRCIRDANGNVHRLHRCAAGF